MRRRYLVTYDVSDDKRRNRVFKTLLGCGDHVQFSVFLCEMNDMEKASMKDKLKQCVHQRTDQVLILDLGSAENPLEVGNGMECVGFAYTPPGRVTVV